MVTPQRQLTIVKSDDEEEESRVVRPELNLEQWAAGIFVPSQARGKTQKVRVLEHTEKLPNGNSLTYSVEVGFSQHGTLTAKDLRVLYALVQNWNDKDSPLSYCYYSTYRLAQILKMSLSAGYQERILDSLRRLRGVLITFKSCFHDAEKKEICEEEQPINILSDLKIRIRKKDENGKYEPIKSEGYIEFHPSILKNLVRQYTRPVLFDVVLSLRSDIAQAVYSIADRQLATKPTYNITTKKLFDDIGLEGKGYRFVSKRMEKLLAPLEELEGKPLSSGGVLKIAIEATKDKTDKLLTFAKKARLVLPKQKTKKADNTPAPEKELVQRLCNELGISLTVARTLEASHSDRAQHWCEAKKHSREMKDKGAGFFVRAILEGWELPTDYKEIKTRSDRRASEALTQKIEQAKNAHCERFSKDYLLFAETELERISQENAEAFQKFDEQAAEDRKKYEGFGLPEIRIVEARVMYADWFFNDGYWSKYQIPFVSFWEWDEKHNPQKFTFENEASR